MTESAMVPTVIGSDEDTFANFRDAMRRVASSVMIVTSRDTDGLPHGMVASAVISVSMEPASMLVAINRSAGLHPVVKRTGRFCVNLLSHGQQHLLAPFSQTALRGERFRSTDWRDAWNRDAERLPWLAGASASIDCCIEASIDYGTHSLFVGRVVHARCNASNPDSAAPMVWLAGHPVAVSTFA